MKTSDQFESLMRTLLAVRDASHSGVPDTLIEEIVAAHIEEPDNPTVYRRVERAIESAVVDAMLRIDRVEIENFGPFKNRQAISLPDEPGVVIVYGENMRGKTSLLNAIRFALFGKVLGRASREGSLHQIGNWEEAAEGRYGFEVTLQFQSDGHHYRLTRSCRPRGGVVPSKDDDYQLDFYLQRDGDVLGPGEAAQELERIMPEQIARFFLFDGELLQEYEDLLRNESDMGRQISDAIERILGVPILTRSRATLSRVLDDYGKKEAKSAQADNLTSEMGAQMAHLHEQRKVLTEGLERMQADLEQLRTDKATLEHELRRSERFAAMMDKRDALRRSIEDIDEQIASRGSELGAEMRNAWKPLVSSRAAELIVDLKESERSLQLRKMRHEVVLAAANEGGSAHCPTCLQALNSATLAAMTETAAGEALEIQQADREIREVQRRLGALEDAARVADGSGLRVLWKELHRLKRDRFAREDDAAELERRLAEADQSALRRAQSEHEQTVKKIALLEEGIQGQEQKLSETQRNLEKVRTRLESMGGADVEGARRRRALCADLHGLFDEAVGVYRERLRSRVEADATELFLQLTTEPDYAGLRINESYGLTILHRDGSEIPVRSAGAEHVVALSLVGALQKNAPLRGPIFIDSPFGRLDTQHTKNVVSALPTMTEQVCLLVYEDELRPQVARELLKGQLRAEYSLRRVSARHTDLEAIGARRG